MHMHIYKAISVVAALAATVVVAAPAGGLDKRTLKGIKVTGCDLSTAQLPHRGTDPKLPDPSPGTKLTRVVLGRGTQNYTCKGSPDDKPTANGAIAILYDASCLAAKQPSLLHELPGALLQLEDSTEYLAAAILQTMSREKVVVGHHYFSAPTTPVFDFRVHQSDTDIFVGKKVANVTAPEFSIKGRDNEGFGAVDWLKLEAVAGTSGFKEAYRMVTAGGAAPPTCKDRPSEFTIPYSTEYWFYS